MISPKGYPTITDLKGRLAWARDQRGWSIQEAVAKFKQEYPNSDVHWLHLRQLETGFQQGTTSEFLTGLAKLYRVDPEWLEKGPSERPERAPEPVREAKVLPAHQEPPAPTPALSSMPPGAMRAIPEGTLGARVRAKRLEMGLSQQAVADRLGTTNQTLSAMELGKQNAVAKPMQAQVLRFLGLHEDAAALGVSEEEIAKITPSRRAPNRPQAESPGARERLGLIPGAGQRIRQQREVLGLTQGDIERRTGGIIKPYQISNVEFGKSTQPIDVALLAKALEVTPEYLLKGVGGPTVPLSETIPPKRQVSTEAATAAAALQRAATDAFVKTRTKVLDDAKGTEAIVRPRQVTNIEVEADDTAFYVFCTRKAFKRSGNGMEATEEMVAPLSLSPKLAKSMHNLLGTMLAEYEQALGPIAS